MAFVKHTWIPKLTRYSAAMMNRIEQGVADAHDDLAARKNVPKVVDFDTAAASSIGITGLDGDAHHGYDVFLSFLYKNVSSEHAPYMRPNTGFVRSRSHNVDTNEDGAGVLYHGARQARTGTGLSLGETTQAPVGRIRGLITGRLLASRPSAGEVTLLWNGQYVYRASIGATATSFRSGLLNGYVDMNAAFTNLDLMFDNAPVVGKLILRPLVGSF
jgi:hypothetical protein